MICLFHDKAAPLPLILHFTLLPLQRLKRTLQEGITPAFGGIIHLVSECKNIGTLPVFEIENESKGGTAAMTKSASEVPFLADDEFA